MLNFLKSFDNKLFLEYIIFQLFIYNFFDYKYFSNTINKLFFEYFLNINFGCSKSEILIYNYKTQFYSY